MSICSNVTEQDLIKLSKLAEQQTQRTLKIKNSILKQIHDVKLAESLSPITKKLDTINDSNKTLGKYFKESNSENENKQEIAPVDTDSDNSGGDNTNLNTKAVPNSSIFRDLMTKTFRRLRSSPNSLRRKHSSSGATIHGVSIYTLDGDKFRIHGKDYDLTPEIYKALFFYWIHWFDYDESK